MANNKENKIDFGNEQTKASTKKLILDVLDGSILKKQGLLIHLNFIVFLAFLAVIYIGNRHSAENLFIETKTTRKELIDIRCEAINIESKLNEKKKQSSISKLLEQHSLKIYSCKTPFKKIYVDD